MLDVNSLDQTVFDHPAPEADRAFGDDQDLSLPQLFDLVLPHRSEEVRAGAQGAVDSQGVQADAGVLVHHPPGDDSDQVAVDLSDQAVLIANPVTLHAKQFGVEPSTDEIVVVALDAQRRPDGL